MKRPILVGLMSVAVLWAGTQAACSSDDPVTPSGAAADAGGADALGDAEPADAADGAPALKCPLTPQPDPLSAQMSVFDDTLAGPSLVGATIEIRKRSDDSIIDSKTAGVGNTTFSLVSGGKPLDAIFRITAPPSDGGAYVPIRIGFQSQMRDKTGLGFIVSKTTTWDAVAAPVGVVIDPAKAIVQVFITNCKLNGLAGATVQVSGGSKVFYERDVRDYDTSLTSTKTGQLSAFNVAPGPTTITATLDGVTTTYDTTAYAGEVTFIFMNP